MRTSILLLLAMGCRGPLTSGETRTGLASWYSEPLPERVLVDECSWEIFRASPRSAYDHGGVDEHQEVYGDRGAEPFHVHLGWPSTDPSTSIAFVWHTGDSTLATQVQLTREGGETEVFEGVSYVSDRRVHEVRLCDGLVPNSTYSYRVGGEGAWSDEYQFTTPGAPGSFDTFRIAMMGDSRGSYELFGDLMAQADAHEPDFFVFSGDMVNSGTSQSEWDSWFEAASPILAEKVLVPALGNAERYAENYFAQFSLPNNEEWFSLHYGTLHLVSLNDTVRDITTDYQDQAEYLNEVLGDVPSDWQVATHHQPIYTTNNTHSGNQNLLLNWVPVYEQHGVDLVLNGHNHFYERSLPILGGAAAPPGEGTTYIVSGGAGAPLYTSYEETSWFRRAVATTEHYLIVDFSPGRIDGTTYDLAGNVLDVWSIER